MRLPKVTVIVTQRERFSLTEASLNSILADNSYPFELIYVDANSPNHIYQYLQEQAKKFPFMTLIRKEQYLKCNEAKNIALANANTSDYVVFIDNDVIVQPGWLKPLIDCAQEEQAAIVTPLILQGDPQSPDVEIHVTGIKLTIQKQSSGKIWLDQKHLMRAVKLRDAYQTLERLPVDATDLHCLLVRRSFLERVPLDEAFDSTHANIDLGLQAAALGEKVFVEPSSIVTFLDPRMIKSFDHHDLKLYGLRWSEKCIRETIDYAKKKWNIADNDPAISPGWKWVVVYRQLPLVWATSDKSFYRKLLRFCQRRRCPSWVRVLLEFLVMKLTFPKAGIPSNLRHGVNHSAVTMQRVIYTDTEVATSQIAELTKA